MLDCILYIGFCTRIVSCIVHLYTYIYQSQPHVTGVEQFPKSLRLTPRTGSHTRLALRRGLAPRRHPELRRRL